MAVLMLALLSAAAPVSAVPLEPEAGADAPARIATTVSPSRHMIAVALSRLLEAEGVKTEFREFPQMRSVYAVEAGLADIEVMRIDAVAAAMPSLIQIEKPVMKLDLVGVRPRLKDGSLPPPLPADGSWRTWRIGVPNGVLSVRIIGIEQPIPLEPGENVFKPISRFDMVVVPAYLVSLDTALPDDIVIERLPGVEPNNVYVYVNGKRPDLAAVMRGIAEKHFPLDLCRDIMPDCWRDHVRQ